MSTKVIKEGNVTTTIMDLTNGVGGRSAEVGQSRSWIYSYQRVTNKCLFYGPVSVVSKGWNLKRLKFPD